MSNELAHATNTQVAGPITNEIIDNYLFGSDTKLNEAQKTLFKGMATSLNLNPFKREIYPIAFEKNVKNSRGVWEKVTDLSIVTGYQVYIDRAAASGNLDGWKVQLTEEGAKITIYRKDFKYPFEWEVEKEEFIKKDREGKVIWSWKTMPNFMIKKIAIGQGFRLAFPNELAGIPYLQEEIVAGEVEEIESPKKEAPKKVTPTTVKETVEVKEVEPIDIEVEKPIEKKPEVKAAEVKATESTGTMARAKALSDKQISFIENLWDQFWYKDGEKETRFKAALNHYYKKENLKDLSSSQGSDFIKRLQEGLKKIGK